MKITYDTLTIEVPYQVLGVLDVRIEGHLNAHGQAQVELWCKQEDAKDIVFRSLETDRITISENGRCLFTGILSNIREKRKNGMTCLSTTWKTGTINMDITKRKLAITGEKVTFADILDRITKNNQTVYLEYLKADAVVPGFLLQYDETDWQFMKRLAAMCGGVLVPDFSSVQGGFTFGIRDTSPMPITDEHGQKTTLIDYETYDKKEASGKVAFLQDCYHFSVVTHEHYELGQMVQYGYVKGLIESFEIYADADLIVKKYSIVTKAGVQPASAVNQTYAGLHLTATVSEVKTNQIRVDFDMDQMTGTQNRYFPYAVESSAWYCMPEIGSSVHIYLPENDETKAYAVHSMRNTTAGAKNASVTSDPGVKSFTHPSGSAMQLDNKQLCLTADGTGQTQATLGSDGMLGLKAKKITIRAAGKITIGTGDTNTENVTLSSGMDITLMSEQGAYAYLGEQTYLQGQNIKYEAKIHDAVQIPQAILERNKEIDKAIANVNYGAKQMQLQKVQESKSKIGMGVFAMVAGAVAIAAFAVVTGGAGLLVVGAVGLTAIGCGASMAAEGVQDYKKAMESGDYSQSFNFVRDTVFQGNQTLYDIVTYGSVMICGVIIATQLGGGGMAALKTALTRMGTETAIDTAMNMTMDYIDDGSINNGWDSYLKSISTTFCTAGMSMGMMDKFKSLEASGKYSCAQLSKMRLATDVALDSMVSVATTGDADMGQIFLRNYLSNKLTLADPVDGATGSLYIPATDMRVPDFFTDYCITRKYESINRRTGILGYGWTCSLESRLSYRSGACLILCTDGHVEGFHKYDGVWKNDKGNTQRMQLQEYVVDGAVQEWRLYDAIERMQYIYDKTGKLVELIEHHGKHAKYIYENNVLCAVTTFAGATIEVTMQNGRLTQLKDVLGRTVTYTYDEENRLVCVNQNGRGLTRYTYDRRGRIVDITDQNNKKYTKNTFDVQGRVIRQDYPDGTSCEITYDDRDKTASFYYPETGGRQTTYHNADLLVTRVEYQDGTCEEYEYDSRHNPIREKDRNGNVTIREYSDRGEKIKEIQPNGLEITYEYDENGNLLKQSDSQGGCISYSYDIHNNLIQKSTLVSEEPQKWSHERYGFDSLSRLIWQEDGQGNRRSYEYDTREAICPDVEISPEGYEFFYTYDKAGRRTKTETAKGRMQFSYNSLHYLNHVIDGEGNEIHEERDNLGSLIRHYSHRQYQRRRGYSYEYDYLDRLIKITDPLGRVKQLKRNGQGSILYESPLELGTRVPERVRDNGIRTTYDANDHAVSIHCPDGGSWQRKYDAKGNLVYEKAPGNESQGRYYQYDSNDRLIRVELESGVNTTKVVEKSYRYDLKGQLIEETNALDEQTLYAYDLTGRCIGVWKQTGEEAYQVTTYLYDGAGNVIEERRGRTAVTAWEKPTKFLAIKKSYDKENRLIQVTDGTGAKVLYTYDIMNNRTSEESFVDERTSRKVLYTYDKAGRLVEKKVQLLKDSEVKSQAVTAYAYDQDHNLLSVTLPEGGVIRYIYDEANRPVCRLEADKAHGISRSYVYRYADSCVISMEELYPQEDAVKRRNALLMECESLQSYVSERMEENLCKERPTEVLFCHGKQAQSMYRKLEEVYHDLSGLVQEREQQLDFGEEGKDYLRRTYSYDFRGNLLSESDTLGNRRTYRYDTTGNLTGTRDACGNETTFAYDGQNRLISKTNGERETEYRLSYDAIGRVTVRTDGEGNTTRYEYHPSGKVTTVTGPDGVVDYQATYDVWGNPEHTTDAKGNQTIYEKDIWGRVTSVTLPDGGVEHYSYDYAGNISVATDALGNETHFSYRGDNRVESIKKADGAIKYFGYDAEGRCNQRIDENKTLIRTIYNMDSNPVDVAGKKDVDVWAVMGGELPTQEADIRSIYTYDERGFLTEAAENGTVYHYTRDMEGRTLTKNSWGKTLYENSYDANGRIASLNNGTSVTHYSYDKANRLSKVTSDNGVNAAYRYDKNGMQTQVLYGNGLKTSYTYDNRSQMVGMEAGFVGTQPLLKGVYTYDENGNRITKTEHVLREFGTQQSVVSTAYTYDSMNRLTEESLNGSATVYGYDLAGNRTTKTSEGRTETYLYNSRNQLTELIGNDSHIRYAYDNAGSLVEEKHCSVDGAETKHLTYGYDAYNRNTSVTGTDFTQQNYYDAEGYRYAISENDKVTNFVYRGGMLVSELDADKNLTKGYVLGNEHVGQSTVTQLNGKLAENSYYITDEQGSIRYVLSTNCNVQNYYQYGAFGESIITEETAPNRLRYNAQLSDDLTGLYYLRARYYNPTTGRFTQEDVIYNDGLNLYAYCNHNPVMYCDPSGYSTQLELAETVKGLSYEQIKEKLNEQYCGFIEKKVTTGKVKVSYDDLIDNELLVYSYGDMPKNVNDFLTPHHMPSAESIISDSIEYDKGICLNVREDTHRMTFTYGLGNSKSRAYDFALYSSLSYEDRLKFDQQNIRDAYRLQRPNVNLDTVDIALEKEYKNAIEEYQKNNKCSKK